MAVSYKGKRKLVYKKKEYIWNIRENYDWGIAAEFGSFLELHITAADKSEEYVFPLRPDDEEDYQKLKKYLGIDFDIPEAITPAFVVKLIKWGNRYYVREGMEKSAEQLVIGNDRSYTVMKRGKPFLCVTAEETGNTFDTAVVFGKWLLIGCFRTVYIVDIEKKEYSEMEIPMYFGYFREIGDKLYIFTGVGIIAFDRNMNRLWQNDDLAVDGVTYGELSDDGKTMEISCEMDPPGGWIDRTISTETGRVLS